MRKSWSSAETAAEIALLFDVAMMVAQELKLRHISNTKDQCDLEVYLNLKLLLHTITQ